MWMASASPAAWTWSATSSQILCNWPGEASWQRAAIAADGLSQGLPGPVRFQNGA